MYETYKIICCTCSCSFMMSNTAFDNYKQTGNTFHCLNGHSMHFSESENSKLKKQLLEKENELKNANDSLKFWEDKGVIKKLRNKAGEK